MSAGKYDIVIEEGAGIDGFFTWYQDNDETNPVDLTGYTAIAEFKANIKSFKPYLKLTSAGGTIILGDDEGTIQLVPSLDDIKQMKIHGGVWSIELYSGSLVTRLLEGQVLVSPEVVRDAS